MHDFISITYYYNLVYLKNWTLLTVSRNVILYFPSTIAANQQEYIP